MKAENLDQVAEHIDHRLNNSMNQAQDFVENVIKLIGLKHRGMVGAASGRMGMRSCQNNANYKEAENG